MNIDIRNYIKSNFKGCNKEDISSSINESISDNDEVTLPGMGVLFELVWQNSNEELKENILNILTNYFKKA